MSGVKGKDRLMLYTIRSAYATFGFKSRQADHELFREFANACNLTKYHLTGGNRYAHPPQLSTVKKYFDHFLAKTDYENPLDRFRELHRKLFVKLQTFCKAGVECIRGIILFFSYERGLLRSYDELYEACKYLNENSQWKIVYSEYPDIPEEKIMANLANEELMLYTIVCFAYQTYRISLKFSGMEDSFDTFVRDLCKIEHAYNNGPISVNVPSFRTIRKTFEDYYPLYQSRTPTERVIRAYKMIELENKKGCKAAVHGLLLFLSYYNRILSTYDEVFEVALALTKYTRPEKVEGQEDFTVLANFDINDLIGSLRAQQACQIASEDDVKPDMKDVKLEEESELDNQTIEFPPIDFSITPSSSNDCEPQGNDFKIKKEVDGEISYIHDKTIDKSSDDEPLDIKPSNGDLALMKFLAENANMKNDLSYGLVPENSVLEEVVNLADDDVKAEVDDYLCQFNVTKGDAFDDVDIEEDDEDQRDAVEVDSEEPVNYVDARVVTLNNVTPLDLNLYF
jgi:hypothetical protein